MTDQRARELLAAECAPPLANEILEGKARVVRVSDALRAITAALSLQPQGLDASTVDRAALALVTTERAEHGLLACHFEMLTDADQARYRNRALAAIRAQIASPVEQAGGWQPIETAPKDGSAVLLYFSMLTWHDRHGDVVSFGELRDHVERFETGYFQGGTWFESGTGHDLFEEWRSAEQLPTHWRPLPSPPQQAGGEK